MPTYMDIHEIKGGIAAEEVAKAHASDVAVEGKYGVHYHKYWVNESAGKIFCLCEAPTAEAAMQVHREAHGQVAEKIIQVEPEVADLFLGGSEVNGEGAVLLPGGAAEARDPGIRTVLFTDIADSTSLTQKLGDEMAMEFLRVHDRIVRDALAAAKGREVKHTGDGIWPLLFQPQVRCVVRCKSSVSWLGVSERNAIITSKFALVARPGNRSNKTTISLERLCNWRRGFVPTPNPTKSWYRPR